MCCFLLFTICTKNILYTFLKKCVVFYYLQYVQKSCALRKIKGILRKIMEAS